MGRWGDAAMSGLRGLRGAAVLVTGAASGIGRAIAVRLAEEGAAVGLLDRNAPGAEQAAAAIRQVGGRATAHPADITDRDAVERAVEAMLREHGALQGLVNAAGWERARNFLETDPALWQKLMDINLLGPIQVTWCVLQHMVRQGSGRVVSLASDAGRVGSSGEAVYAACKAGIIAFSKSVARELARSGITLNVVSPGPTDTPLFASFDPSGRLARALERAIPMRRLARPEDHAGIVAFLLSDDAAFITGQTVSVSGGLTMHG